MATLFRKKRLKTIAFTLIELIVSIVIIGILATLALPMFTKGFESARAKQALTALEQIRTAQRLYITKEDFCYPFGPYPATVYIDDINQDLFGVPHLLVEKNWTYEVKATALDKFEVTATRKGSGPHAGQKIILNQDGFDKSSSTWDGPWPGQ